MEKREAFKLLYDFTHDEGKDADNIMALLQVAFKKELNDHSNPRNATFTLLTRYLEARAGMGKEMMNLIYDVDQELRGEEEDATTHKS